MTGTTNSYFGYFLGEQTEILVNIFSLYIVDCFLLGLNQISWLI